MKELKWVEKLRLKLATFILGDMSYIKNFEIHIGKPMKSICWFEGCSLGKYVISRDNEYSVSIGEEGVTLKEISDEVKTVWKINV